MNGGGAQAPSAIDPSVPTDFGASIEFLYKGPNPVQVDVAEGALEPRRVAVVRGKVVGRNGQPIADARVGVLAHPEQGHTLTSAQGEYSLAVNGGGALTIDVEKPGFLPVQRQVDVPWREFVPLPEVVLTALDSNVTAITPGATESQVARGSVVEDSAGSRQATLVFAPGTQAEMFLPDGTQVPLTGPFHVRATEYTSGPEGPSAMPGMLPATSGYTYAVELSVDEALAAGATEVRFNPPVQGYVDNFLAFPAGLVVPSGYYDRQQGHWRTSGNGRVITLVGERDGLAQVDADGDGAPDVREQLTAMGFTDAERARLAALYAVGKSLWRVPVTHFTPYDYNWPFGPPPDAQEPQQPEPRPETPEALPDCESGSIIECQNQTLGEVLSIPGTPFQLHYRSDRAAARTANRALRIPLSGGHVPASLKNIILIVNVAGQSFSRTFPARPNQSYRFVWDGLDAFGRQVWGEQTARIRIGYVYGLSYYASPDDQSEAWARYGDRSTRFEGPDGRDMTLWQFHSATVVSLPDFSQLGGWSLDAHHAYDPWRSTLYPGQGGTLPGRESLGRTPRALTTATPTFSGDHGPAKQARIAAPRGVAVALDGTVYIVDTGNHRIRQVKPNGVIATVAGNGVKGATGDGGRALAASLDSPEAMAVGPEGTLYIADTGNHRIRRVTPDGVISTLAGTGLAADGGDGGPATLANLRAPAGVAVGPDGGIYLADTGNHRIRRVTPDGNISTVAGTGVRGSAGEGGLAIAASLDTPRALVVGPEGFLSFVDSGSRRLRRVDTEGRLFTLLAAPDEEEVRTATRTRRQSLDAEAPRGALWGLALGPDGSLYTTSAHRCLVHRLFPDGSAWALNRGGCGGEPSEEGPAALLSSPRGIAMTSHGEPLVADESQYIVRRVSLEGNLFVFAGGGPEAPVVTAPPQYPVGALETPCGQIDDLVPSPDGSELYGFGWQGRHLCTLEAWTLAVRYRFSYDEAARLVSITDGAGLITRIERDAAGAPTAILAPHGQRTTLRVGPDGLLASFVRPGREGVAFTYQEGGLLSSLRDEHGGLHGFAYTPEGWLTKDSHPSGGFKALERTQVDKGYSVTLTTALGRTRKYQVEDLESGVQRRVTTASDGTMWSTLRSPNGTTVSTAPDGRVTTVVEAPEPRLGMQSPLVASRIVKLPSGLTSTSTHQREVTLLPQGTLLDVGTQTDRVTVNGRTTTLHYEPSGRRLLSTTPMGRVSVLTLDAQGRLHKAEAPGLLPVEFTYDAEGRPGSVIQGSRRRTFTYGAEGALRSVTDGLDRATVLTRDEAGRITSSTRPGNRVTGFTYGTGDAPASVTPPGRSPHVFQYTASEALASYAPPGGSAFASGYSYDRDDALTELRQPGGTVAFAYDAAGRLATLDIPGTRVTTGYDEAGRLRSLASTSGVGLEFSHDGPLVTGVSWKGAVAGSLQYSHDTDFRIATSSVNGEMPVAYAYDLDGLLVSAGALTLSRRDDNGLLVGTQLGSVSTVETSNAYGEQESWSASSGNVPLLSYQLERDVLGRIVRRTETEGTTVHTDVFTHDEAGRLASVTRDGILLEANTYDTNGNRTSVLRDALQTATHDVQDRLLSFGNKTYSYGPGGDLQTRTEGARTTQYAYDALGALVHVEFPEGTQVEYVLDAASRRVGKKVDGTLIQGFLYEGRQVIAELDGAGNVVSRFVHATRGHAPDFMIKGGIIYRILADPLGSPRLVVDTRNGTVVQRMEYDVWGNVVADSSPGFQPFGFAGGLYDRHTKLTRFGARDYDAETGRWTAKDPIRFAGGDSNLYAYAANQPHQFIDPDGRRIVSIAPALQPAFNNIKATELGRFAIDKLEHSPHEFNFHQGSQMRDREGNRTPGQSRPMGNACSSQPDGLQRYLGHQAFVSTIDIDFAAKSGHSVEEVLFHEMWHSTQFSERPYRTSITGLEFLELEQEAQSLTTAFLDEVFHAGP
ncbi:RHS repeat-associated core domain-containing protein [Corallococcus sp. RDP092CA]|uniref:NHL domain-containing protein n=1 Tax=Corallococcus sp. RDP092CA TaxID=3109369 RepID=UPI0035AF10F2